jgi:hypothetical protein
MWRQTRAKRNLQVQPFQMLAKTLQGTCPLLAKAKASLEGDFSEESELGKVL